MILPQAARLLQKYLDDYEAIPGWDTFRTDRLNVILPLIFQFIDGDVLEIGAHQGGSTSIFCEVGDKYNRNVIVIDPWDGRQEGNNQVYSKFKENTASFTNLVVYKLSSDDPSIREKFTVSKIKLSFILIDGLHSYAAVKNDIEKYLDFLSPHGILCIDDWRGPYKFSAEIRKAALDHLGDNIKELNTPNSFIEQYFVKGV